jgi:hypothetical protein
MRTHNTALTPEQRCQHAEEWRSWRKRNPVGARRGWAELRDNEAWFRVWGLCFGRTGRMDGLIADGADNSVATRV